MGAAGRRRLGYQVGLLRTIYVDVVQLLTVFLPYLRYLMFFIQLSVTITSVSGCIVHFTMLTLLAFCISRLYCSFRHLLDPRFLLR